MKKIVVTGANGYIGSHLIKEIYKHGDIFQVLAVDIRDNNIPEEIPFCKCNFLDECNSEDLYQRLGEPDICVHLAWRDGFAHDATSHITDFSSHFAFLKNLADSGTSQFVVAGSFREYGSVNGMVDENAICPIDNMYTLSKQMLKRALELYFTNKDIVLQWIRPFTVYGDDQMNNSILTKIMSWEREGKKSFPFTDGTEQYDYISVFELAKQITAICNQRTIKNNGNEFY